MKDEKTVSEAIEYRRSIRVYDPDQPLDTELVKRCIEQEESFIPHEVEQDDSPKAPVGIGWQNPTDRHGVLVNLGGALPPWFSHFDHLVEIVVQEPKVLDTTRNTWKQLKFDGYPITQHDLRK